MNVRAVLFDYGGTLDGAQHWLPRFFDLYNAAGMALSLDEFRNAFDHTTQRGYEDRRVAEMSLADLIEFHVTEQMRYLGIEEERISEQVTTEFLRISRAALEESRGLLERLSRRVPLGVISNFYGNLDRILDEARLAPLLRTIIDSTRVGLFKPDPQIFALAVQRIGCEPADALYVGDSFEKDVVGAHAAGLRTGWLVGASSPVCSSPELLDVRLRTLTDVETLI